MCVIYIYIYIYINTNIQIVPATNGLKDDKNKPSHFQMRHSI